MPVTLRIIGLANGEPTPFDGQYVKEYDPSYHPAGQEYDGGSLTTTPLIEHARQFPSAGEALEYWRQNYGVRADGLPNRPLTAFTCEVVNLTARAGGTKA